MTPTPSPNFAYLEHHDPRLAALGTQAEQHFEADPTITLWKLRQFSEVLAQRAAARYGVFQPGEPQAELIERLFARGVIRALQRELLHDLRRVGNAAVHEGKGTHPEALHRLKIARELAVWFQQTYGNNKKFDPGPFVPPPEPAKAEKALHDELVRLRDDVAKRAQQLEAAQAAIAEARATADAEAAKKLSAEQIAAKAEEEAAIWEALANESTSSSAAEKAAIEAQNKKLLAELAALQAAAQATPKNHLQAAIDHAGAASDAIQLDEAATRRIIDKQLRAAGWDVDSTKLTWERGVRPTRGKNLAIAEWPTEHGGQKGWADYALFAGLQVVGVVEAKRHHKDVMSVLSQSKRYALGFLPHGEGMVFPAGGPWDEHKVPFLFSTNGRPYLRQLQTKSGIWFRDARRRANHPVALEGWYTPEGLLDLLKQDVDDAHARLKVEPMHGIDRAYQKNAILAVEKALEEGRREMLVAMATGTGKTRTCIGLCYRLLKTKRFRRVLFLVDRTALGDQTADAMKELRLENLQTFTDIFGVKELADVQPDRETRFHIATVQAMVRRVLGGVVGADKEGDLSDVPPVDQYDCVVVDECHRGYLLDRELSDRELLFRDEDDYISKYRRVLDHFDAVKIGLTATPALHTKEIFGAPIFSYGYREAVVDGFLVDHDPPIRIVTKQAADGLHYAAKEEVLVLDRTTNVLHKEELPDEVHFEVTDFNRRVITEGFNRAVIGELVRHIDPEQEEKTLVFAATDAHADMVVLILKEALKAHYGSVDNDAVLKITGSVDHPKLDLRRYRNERYPNIVVTVNLLTTGIDVPRIANLVFLRSVSSRILYEQMIGRATRLCPDIGKERFRIFDAVDLYSRLKDVTDMKPVVVNPTITFEELVKEVIELKDDDQRRESLEELLAKLQRKKRRLKGEAEERFQAAAGMDVKELAQFLKLSLKQGSPGEAASYFKAHPVLAGFLDREAGSTEYKLVVSERTDEIREVTQLQGASKGVFITTSSFSKDAQAASGNSRGSLVLVNGASLTELMCEYGVGVQHKAPRAPKADSDYFEEADRRAR